MKQNQKALLAVGSLLAALLLQTGCADEPAPTPSAQPSQAVVESTAPSAAPDGQVAGSSEMSEIVDVVEDDMVPITADQLKDGVYELTVSSSSKMFKIVSCQLTVADGKMTAVMTMGGKGYTQIFMGTGAEAAAAAEDACIPFAEDAEGSHTYTVEVEALDAPVPCAAFSKNKEKWYERTLVFRADSLPLDAFQEGLITLPEHLALADGDYLVDVALKGGSGKTSVTSPAKLQVKDGVCTATIVWSSSNYDYMKVQDVMYEPVSLEPGSTFVLPVTCFDWRMPVLADTIAMSEPHEIAYTLIFDSASITPAD